MSSLPLSLLRRALDTVQRDDLLHYLHADGLTKMNLPDTRQPSSPDAYAKITGAKPWARLTNAK